MDDSTDKNVGFYLGTAVLVAWRILTAVAQITWYVGEAVWRDRAWWWRHNWREPAGASAFLVILFGIFVGWPACAVWLMVEGTWWPLLLTMAAWTLFCLAIAATERNRPWFTKMTIDH